MPILEIAGAALRRWSPLVLLEVAIVAAIPVSYHVGHGRGESAAHAEDAAKSAAAVAAMDQRYRAKEVEHAKQIELLRLEYAREDAKAAAVDAAMARDLGAGVRRVRLPVTRCRPDSAQAGAPAGRADDASTAELPGPIAAALYAIAADGDRYARQLTELQNWARSAVNLCNGDER